MPTCVGFSTDTPASPCEAFLGRSREDSFWLKPPVALQLEVFSAADLPAARLSPTGLPFPIGISSKGPTSLRKFKPGRGGAGILACCPSPTPFGLG